MTATTRCRQSATPPVGSSRMPDLMKIVQDEIDRQRWGVRELSEEIDADPTYVGRVIRGERKPGPEILGRLMDALGMKVSVDRRRRPRKRS